MLVVAVQGVRFFTPILLLLGMGVPPAWGNPNRAIDFSANADSGLVIRDLPITPDHPAFEGERFVLTTVGAEHDTPDGMEFHPLVSVLVDDSFPEASRGEWLAVWNLGHRGPNLLDRMVALFPGLVTESGTSQRVLRKLNKRLQARESAPPGSRRSLPKPFLKATQGTPRANEHAISFGLKRALNPIIGLWTNAEPISFSLQLLYRNYLLRHSDFKTRQFEQAYLGLSWYTDLARFSRGQESLSAAAIADLKFKLLASRHLLGRWVEPGESEDFVHGFESQMRDHLWGTSCYLASAANEHHLSYQEFHRYTAGDVPLALGGILYYDPSLAPEPAQINWPRFNPFDLTYNPFQDPRVQTAATGGKRVPLAVYVYQSNTALKPIIAVDFFNPSNPRVREASTYWHKLGDEALGAYGISFFPWVLNKTGSFLVNRKGLSLFSDRQHSLGLEELRLSLLSHLYFEEESADRLLLELDRVLIHPLTQASQAQSVRARIQYLDLAREEPLLKLGRKLRAKTIRRTTGLEGPIDDTGLAAYRRYLRRRQGMRSLKTLLTDDHLPSIPTQQISDAFESLLANSQDADPELAEFLMQFREHLVDRSSPPGSVEALWMDQTEEVLVRLYASSGRTPEQMAGELDSWRERRLQEAEKKRLALQEQRVKDFKKRLELKLQVLRDFNESDGDMMKVSPWFLSDALDFFAEAGTVLRVYPGAEVHYRKSEAEIRDSLAATQSKLEARTGTLEVAWLDEQRSTCLRAARRASRQVVALSRTSDGVFSAEEGAAETAEGGGLDR